MKGVETVVFPAAFLAGGVAGAFLVPDLAMPDGAATLTLYALMVVVGVAVGARPEAFDVVRRAGVKLAAVPVLVMAGSLAGAAALGLVWPGLDLRASMAVGGGVGYYSLTSVLAGDLAGETLGVVALLANLFREALTLALAPLMARLLGPGAPLAAGGATAMDTTLPVITRTSGESYGIVAVFSGAVLTAAVPVVVTVLLGL